VGAVVGIGGRLTSYLSIQPVLAQHDLDFALGSAEFWSSLAGAGLYFALIGVMAVGIGTLLRNSAAAIAAVIGVLFIAPMMLWLAPGEVAASLVNFLPSEAGTQLMLTETAAGDLTPLQGGLLLALWALLPLLAGVTLASQAQRSINDETAEETK
jgi:ABC-2 type transport system permease protein